MQQRNTHLPKKNMLGVYDPHGLAQLRDKLRAAGHEPPDPSFRLIDYHPSWYGWRVQLTGLVGAGVTYFQFSDYGGSEAALIEAQYFRDAAFAKAGVGLYMRVRQRFSKRAKNTVLSMFEATDRRNGRKAIVGTWVATEHGVSRQRRGSRSYGRIRSREAAWDEVESIVRAAVTQEAGDRRAAADAARL